MMGDLGVEALARGASACRSASAGGGTDDEADDVARPLVTDGGGRDEATTRSSEYQIGGAFFSSWNILLKELSERK